MTQSANVCLSSLILYNNLHGVCVTSIIFVGAKVEFNEGEDVRQYENCIVECSWDGDDGVWRFMRVRTDKQLPNAKHVYEKVLASIKDNIEQEDIIAEVEEAMKSSVYEKDRLHKPAGS